ncbi:hypothetical protein J2T21_002910 [Paeniglutamicibacter psychrophenolicus]|nr:hypothetical protein [Paeniglutamicibacter psychrophenolicus]
MSLPEITDKEASDSTLDAQFKMFDGQAFPTVVFDRVKDPSLVTISMIYMD